MPAYKAPAKKVHRGFMYLNDETVINSLSAVEAGKIDEVVAKVNSAREGGLGGAVGTSLAKVEGGRKATSGFEEEMVRTRTRFSIFELWYQTLRQEKALGTFTGWGDDALDGVSHGDTVEFRGDLEAAPIQTLARLYLWFAEQAKTQGHIFSQKGDALKETKDAERNFKMMLGDPDDESAEVVVTAVPKGEAGPAVAMPIQQRWLIGALGQLGGEYTVVAQVDRLIGAGEELPALRLTRDVAATPLEVETLKEALSHFIEPAKVMGIDVSVGAATINGPAMWLQPIAIFR